MRGPVDTRNASPPPPPQQPQLDEVMQAQDAQMRALQQRAMMLAARQRELDAIEARMERASPMERAARVAPPMFVISSMKQAPSKPIVEVLPSEGEEDERSVALSEKSEALSSTEATQHLSDAQSESGIDTESQASSTQRRRKSYTRKSKNKLRV